MAAKKKPKRRAARRAKGSVARPAPAEDVEAQFRRHWMVEEAKRHLAAYALDRDLVHILRAALTVAERGDAPDWVMVANLLRHAIAVLEKAPSRKHKPVPRNADRDTRILRRLGAFHGTIPKRLSGELVTEIARRERISEQNVRTIVSRYRAILADQENYKRGPVL